MLAVAGGRRKKRWCLGNFAVLPGVPCTTELYGIGIGESLSVSLLRQPTDCVLLSAMWKPESCPKVVQGML